MQRKLSYTNYQHTIMFLIGVLSSIQPHHRVLHLAFQIHLSPLYITEHGLLQKVRPQHCNVTYSDNYTFNISVIDITVIHILHLVRCQMIPKVCTTNTPYAHHFKITLTNLSYLHNPPILSTVLRMYI